MRKGRSDECWPWTGGTQGKGYGQFYPKKNQPVGAHRWAWSEAHGVPVPDRMHVLHSCDNPPCVNPAHLRVGTAADNMRDKSEKGRNPGNPTTRGGKPLTWEPAIVKSLRDRGLTFKAIGDLLGVSPATALRTLRKF